MSSFFLHVALVVLAQTGPKEAPRQPNPLAPSLPVLTKEEAARYEAIINRFIKFDIGQLKGGEGKKAFEEFNRLPAEAIFELIEGFNRAANLEHSCPAVIIGKKILKILNASEDLELLAFAKENFGADVTAKRHLGMLREVQFGIQLRKGDLQRRGVVSGAKPIPAPPGERSLAALTLAELMKKAEKENGLHLKQVLIEIEKRPGQKVFEVLAIATVHEDADMQKLVRGLLDKHMTRQSPLELKDLLKNDRPQIRSAAAKEVGARKIRHIELIDLLNDADPAVQQAAHQALVRISGVDHGPSADASFGDREAAQRRWRQWWESAPKR